MGVNTFQMDCLACIIVEPYEPLSESKFDLRRI